MPIESVIKMLCGESCFVCVQCRGIVYQRTTVFPRIETKHGKQCHVDGDTPDRSIGNVFNQTRTVLPYCTFKWKTNLANHQAFILHCHLVKCRAVSNVKLLKHMRGNNLGQRFASVFGTFGVKNRPLMI